MSAHSWAPGPFLYHITHRLTGGPKEPVPAGLPLPGRALGWKTKHLRAAWGRGEAGSRKVPWIWQGSRRPTPRIGMRKT